VVSVGNPIHLKALRDIIEMTEGYTEHGVPVAFWANVVAKRALGIDVSAQVCNHDDEMYHPDTCKACAKLGESIKG
jgi:hypothetical protein